MPACLICAVDIHDPGPHGAFMAQVRPLVEALGGRYLARDGRHEVPEGDWRPSRPVPFEFPDMPDTDAARRLFTRDE